MQANNQDLFLSNPPPPAISLAGEKSVLSVPYLIDQRKRAGRSLQLKGFNNYFNHPDYLYQEKLETFLESEPLLNLTGNAAEFASVSFLNPAYIEVLKKADKAARLKSESLERFNKRVEGARVESFPARGVLGNIGNNLDSFEKQTRERRYRIQEAIQKNDLVPGKIKEVEKLDQETGEIYKTEVYQKSAVCSCGMPIQENIHLKRNSEYGNISLAGVATCGSVWACPVCRAKIVNKRADDLEKMYLEGKKRGWEFHMITFTFPHGKNDNLAELYGSSNLGRGLSGAFTKFRRSRVWSKKLKSELDFIGDVRAVEITWGWQNGFHPHIHLILITRRRFDIDKWQNILLKQWQRNCLKSGLGKPNEKGVRIDYVATKEMAAYPAKWSVGSELQSESVKESKAGNFSISELELCLVNEDLRKQKKIRLNRVAGVLKAYYAAMHGQKQLVYGGLNTGWRDEIGLTEETDETLASEEFEAEKTDHLLVIERSLYRELKQKNVFTRMIEHLEAIPWQLQSGNMRLNILKAAGSFISRHGINLDKRLSLEVG